MKITGLTTQTKIMITMIQIAILSSLSTLTHLIFTNALSENASDIESSGWTYID